MGNLRRINMQMGTQAAPLQISQNDISTLCAIYGDSDLTEKSVTGYVHAVSITARKKWILQQLGLNVTQDTLTPQPWELALTDRNIVSAGSTTISAAFTEAGGLDISAEITVTVSSVQVVTGNVTQQQAAALLSISGRMLTFNGSGLEGRTLLSVTLSAVTAWDNTAHTIQVTARAGFGEILSTTINPASESAALVQSGSRELLEEYIAACKPYVLTADGTKKAEIASATFEGAYAGMTSGTVTFKDGTVKQISDLNAAGCNFMVYRPELYISSGMEGGAEKLKILGIYDIGATKRYPAKYIGMFKAYTQSGVLKSQPNRIPTGGKNIAAFHSEARALSIDYGLWNYTDWCRENVLHLAHFHNTNYESNVGIGRINNYNNVRNIVTGFTLPLLSSPLACGVRQSPDSVGNSVNSLMFFGIEGLGEQIWEFVIGFRHDGAGHAVIWEQNEWGEGHDGRALVLPVTSASGSYIKKIIAGADFDMMPQAVGGTSATGYCDGHWITSGGRLLFVGGDAYSGSLCGLSASYAYSGFGNAYDSLGARLAFYGSPSEVAGADLI